MSEAAQTEAVSDELCITGLDGRTFVVPAYQRGYKWQKRDVEYLIMDLAEYEGDNPYYMQPLVVAAKDDKWILVDGQQRLTTFYLIWRKLYEMGIADRGPGFYLDYEKRGESTRYLASRDGARGLKSTDIRHFRVAESVIDREDLANVIRSEAFLKNFYERATFLWYELADATEGPKMFERLNGKRIALTDIELCKVLLLSSSATSKSMRNERAMAWQNMEYRLQDNAFFSFIAKDYSAAHEMSRMDVVLRAICGENADRGAEDDYDEYPIYSALKKRLADGENVWKKITQTFHRIEQWYDTPLYYNLVGFITEATDTSLHELLGDAGHADFGERLRNRIIDWCEKGPALADLRYKDDKTKPALLLYNILCEMYFTPEPGSDKVEDKYGFANRFCFELYRAEKYDKEHVHATNSEQIQSAIEWRQWCRTILRYTPGDRLTEIPEDKRAIMRKVADISPDSKIEDNKRRSERYAEDITKAIGGKEGFAELFESVGTALGEKGEGDLQQNGIGNMALLSSSINRDRAYAASPFAVKRAIIIARQASGAFVPKGTERMFTKAFRPYPDEMYRWNKTGYAGGAEASDTESFTNYFVKIIERFTK